MGIPPAQPLSSQLLEEVGKGSLSSYPQWPAAAGGGLGSTQQHMSEPSSQGVGGRECTAPAVLMGGQRGTT